MVSHVYTWRCALFERGISRAPITCDALLLASRSQAMAGRMEAAEWLLGHGAHALTSTSDGLTAERLAAISGHTKVQLIIMAAAAAIAAPSYAAASSASSGEAAPDRKQHSPARHNLRALSTGRLYRLRKSCCGSGAISSSVLAPAPSNLDVASEHAVMTAPSTAPSVFPSATASGAPAMILVDGMEVNAATFESLKNIVRKTELHAAERLQTCWRGNHQHSLSRAPLMSASDHEVHLAPVVGGSLGPPQPPPRRSRGDASSSIAETAPGDELAVDARCRRMAAGLMDPTTSSVAVETRAQAAHYIDSTLSRELLVKHLKLDLAAMMEKGRVYQPFASESQFVAWRLRFFFCSEQGLCYQKVSSRMRPHGAPRVVPWGAITKVEALLDDSIYIETLTQKKYYIKPKGASDPARNAWAWATRLCQLTQLLGNEVAGHVAMAAYGTLSVRAYGTPKEADNPTCAVSAMLNDCFGDEALYDELLSSRLLAPTAEADRTSLAASVCDLRPGMSHARASGNGMRQPLPPVAADGPKLEEEGEGEETAEEAYRRRQWIIYFVSVGKYTEALDIGWDNLSPPDPRHPLAAAPGHAR